jgi:hypothetical protein
MFTHREKTLKNTTVAAAIANAKSVLKEKGVTTYCSNAVSGRDPNEEITIEEASNLAERIIDDTRFYD